MKLSLPRTAPRVMALLWMALPAAVLAVGQWEPHPDIDVRRGQADRTARFHFESVAAGEALALPRPPKPKLLNPPFRPRALPVPRTIQLEAQRLFAGMDEAPPPSGPPVFSPAPEIDFIGLQDNSPVAPPDTHGAVSDEFVMTILNTQVRIQDRLGGFLSTMSLDAFWAPLGAQRPFDPRLAYDPYERRWIAVTLDGPGSPSSAVLIAVSETSDPRQGWNSYSVNIGASGAWLDFPTLGFNRHWIGVQGNAFGLSGGFDSSRILVFDKADLYAGGAGNYTEFRETQIGFTQQPAVTMDPDLDTLYFGVEWNGNQGGQGFLRLFSVEGPVGAETFNMGPFVASPQPWNSFHPSPNNGFAPQADTSTNIETNGADLGNLVYRNGSLWAAHTIFLPAGSPNMNVVQWWEIDPINGTAIQRGRIEDPAREFHFAFPSIAVNARGDLLVGHAIFAESQYASAGYSLRLESEPPSTIQTPFQFKDGEASYVTLDGFGRNRWGDYSNTVVDPVNDLDFWTVQEYAFLPSGRSRWATWWAHVAVPGACSDCTDPACLVDADNDQRNAIPCGPDCDDDDAGVWAEPEEVANLRFRDGETMYWDDQRSVTGPNTDYQVLFGSLEDGFPVGSRLELCLTVTGPDAEYTLPGFIPLPSPWWFLVKAENTCNAGGTVWGADSAGNDRVSDVCN